MIALILAGGAGTRLQSVVKDKPKPMAEVSGRPFIRHLTDYLFKNGCTKIYISCFYLWEQIAKEYADDISKNIVEIILEPKKLGTGGAIFYSAAKIFDQNPTLNDIIICNGDSFVLFRPMDLIAAHCKLRSSVTLASVVVQNTGRYGILKLVGDNVNSFCEKQAVDQNNIKPEPINAGIYAVNRSLCKLYPQYYQYFVSGVSNNGYNGEEFSFEHKVLMPLAAQNNLKAFNLGQVKFIDIGIPEDYARASEFLQI